MTDFSVPEPSSDLVLQLSRPKIDDASDFARWRKCLFVMIVTFAGSLSPLAANIHSPLHPVMSEEFNVSPKTLDDMIYMFMFVSAVSALVWAQLSDVYGRRWVYLISLSFMFVANLLLTALPASIKTLYGLKALQAIGSSSVYSVGIATIVDVTIDYRGTSFGCFMIGPVLGSVVGQIISIDHFSDQWRYGFGLLTVMSGIAIVSIFALLPETARGVVGTGKYFNQGQFRYTLFQKRVIAGDYLPNQKFHWDLYFRLPRNLEVVVACILASVVISCFYVMCTTFGSQMSEKYDFSPRDVSLSHLCTSVCLAGLSLIYGFARDSEQHGAKGELDFGEVVAVQGGQSTFIGLFLFSLFIDSEQAFGLTYPAIWCFSASVSLVLIGVTHFLIRCVECFPASAIAFSMFVATVGCNIAYFICSEVAKTIGMGWCFGIFLGVCTICQFLIGVIATEDPIEKFNYE